MWCQWQKLASSKDATNELSLIVHLIVLDPICMRQNVSGSDEVHCAVCFPEMAYATGWPGCMHEVCNGCACMRSGDCMLSACLLLNASPLCMSGL